MTYSIHVLSMAISNYSIHDCATLHLFYLIMHSTHFIGNYYGIRHMVKNHSNRREKTHCHYYIGYSIQLAAKDILYTTSHGEDSTYQDLCDTSCGAMAGLRNSSVGSPCWIDPMTNCTITMTVFSGLLTLIKCEFFLSGMNTQLNNYVNFFLTITHLNKMWKYFFMITLLNKMWIFFSVLLTLMKYKNIFSRLLTLIIC